MTRRIAKKTIQRMLDGIDEKMPESQEFESPRLHRRNPRGYKDCGGLLL
jgi:hypothetical protein